MKISVVTCISTAIHLLNSTINSRVYYAGKLFDWELIVVTWNPSVEVQDWLDQRPWIIQSSYTTNNNVGYVPNLRAMINQAFDEGYKRNDYVVLTDMDVMYAPGWLAELEKYADANTIVNSLHITPIKGTHVITRDLGRVGIDFKQQEFIKLYNKYCKPGKLRIDRDCPNGWRDVATMPYIMHKKWWEQCGPWELVGVGRQFKDPPDRRFFKRCADAGARFIMSYGSMVYHEEGGERRKGTRPQGTQNMKEEG